MKKLITFTVLGLILASCYRPPNQSWQPKKNFGVAHTRKKKL